MNSNPAIRFLRISMGLVMFLHGIMKVLGGPTFWQTLGGLPPMVPEIPWLRMSLGIVATFIELLGGLLLIINWRVRDASISIVLVMIAAFTYHLPNVDGFRSLMMNTWPLELALVYAAIAWLHPTKGR
jgi:putative oxidoreductase